MAADDVKKEKRILVKSIKRLEDGSISTDSSPSDILFEAIINGDAEGVASAIVEWGAYPCMSYKPENGIEESFWYHWSTRCSKNKAYVALTLLRYGADRDKKGMDRYFQIPWEDEDAHILLKYCLDKKILTTGQQFSSRPNCVYLYETLLHKAAILDITDDSRCIAELVRRNPEHLEKLDESGRTPLGLAARALNFRGVRRLLELGADVEGGEERPPFFEAAVSLYNKMNRPHYGSRSYDTEPGKLTLGVLILYGADVTQCPKHDHDLVDIVTPSKLSDDLIEVREAAKKKSFDRPKIRLDYYQVMKDDYEHNRKRPDDFYMIWQTFEHVFV